MPHSRTPLLRRLAAGTLASALVVGALTVLTISPAAAAVATYTVTTSVDTPVTEGPCGSSATSATGSISLREATCLANNNGTNPVVINFANPLAPITLTNGELQLGKVSGSNITVNGNAGQTIIDGGNNSRVLDLDPNLVGGVTTTITNLTIRNGKDDTFGGAGIIGGSNFNTTADALTLTNVTMTGNRANVTNPNVINKPGGALQFLGGRLTITNSTFSNNTSGSSDGSAVAYGANGAASPEGLTVTGSTFNGNTVANTSGQSTVAKGGALWLFGTGTSSYSVTGSTFTGNTVTATNGSGSAVGAAIKQDSGALTVTQSTFTGNTVSGGNGSQQGGAIQTGSTQASTTLTYNRFTGNTASSGAALYSTGTTNAANNWWGCNGGPGSAGCDTTAGSGITATPRLQLSASVSPSPIVGPNGTGTVTASLRTNSASAAVAGTNLTAFDGLNVGFSDPAGTATVGGSSGAKSVALSGGQASTSLQTGTETGASSSAVTFDNASVTASYTVITPPSTTTPANQTVAPGGNATFSTTASGGTPSYAYQWQVNTGSGFANIPVGAPYSGTTAATLTVSNATAAMNGYQYRVVTTDVNGLSVTSGAATLTVQAPPSVTQNPVSFRANPGTPGFFQAAASGTPTPTVQWQRSTDGGASFQNVGGATSTTYVTPAVTAADDGNLYRAVFTNLAGTATTTAATLRVNTPPTTSTPVNQTVAPGGNATFSTTASGGTPSYAYQWQVNTGSGFANIPVGAPYSGTTAATLTVSNATAAMNGYQYRVVTTDANGLSVNSGAATLTVYGITTQPQSTTVNAGQPASFSVTPAGGSTPYAYQWQVSTDGGGSWNNASGATATASTYSFTAQGADNGNQYRVRITDSATPTANTITSSAATLTVNTAPTATNPSSVTKAPGQTATFSTTVTGRPTPSIKWQVDTGSGFADVSNAGPYSGATTGTLTVTNVTAAMNGYQYRAVATNGVNPAATSAPATLTVQKAPSFTSADTTSFTVGTNKSFPITASGVPDPTITQDAGDPTIPGLTFSGGSLSGIPTGDGGTYKLHFTASNGVSPNATQELTVTVGKAPSIDSANHATFQTGVDESFTVRTSGFPNATIGETGSLPNGVSLVDNHDGTATLGGTPTQAGSFSITITAANGYGTNASQSFTLTVNQAPSFTSGDTAEFTVGTNGTFTVTTDGNPTGDTITKDADDAALPNISFADNGDGTATLTGTPTGNGGTYTLHLTASNGVNPDATQTLTVKVYKRATIVTDPTDQTVEPGATATFTVAAVGNPAPGMQWQVNDGNGWTDIANETGTSFSVVGGPSTEGKQYRAVASNTIGGTPYSDSSEAAKVILQAAPAFTSATTATFTVGTTGSFDIETSGAPTVSSITTTDDLPPGLDLSTISGGKRTLSGTPTGSGGTYTLHLTATNGVDPAAEQTLTITVNKALAFTSADHTTFTAGDSASFDVTTIGFPKGTVSLSSATPLPSGLSFTPDPTDSSKGTISGTPATSSDGSYTLSVTNGGTPVTQTFHLTVNKKTQSITVGSVIPTPSSVGKSYTASATSDSGLTVAIALGSGTTNSACSFNGTTVSLDAVGHCEITYKQAGNAVYQPASQVTDSFDVTAVSTTTTVTPNPLATVYGETKTVTATITRDGSGAAPAGSVQFKVDGNDLGSPVNVSNGTATSPTLTGPAGARLTVGSHPVTAVFTPTVTTAFAGSTGTVSDVVGKAATATKVSVQATTVKADVTVVAPGSGNPSGQVTFRIGTTPIGQAPVVNGTATLVSTVPAGQVQNVSAEYGGDGSFTGSTDSVTRNDPTITATVTAGAPISSYGWYRTPVTVTFTCTADGSPIASCPTPVVLTGNGAGQSVTGTAYAENGGIKSVTVTGINVDTVAPTAHVIRISKPHRKPRARCDATDTTSGVASCVVKLKTKKGKTKFTATITDLAGNVTTATGPLVKISFLPIKK